MTKKREEIIFLLGVGVGIVLMIVAVYFGGQCPGLF
jgi:hypothetical protein